MTVYTVIGHITNAILTFEPLPIPSNLSGGALNSLSLDDIENHFQSHQMDLENAYLNKIETMAGDDEIALMTVNDDTSQGFLLGGMLGDEITMKPLPWIRDSMEKNPFYSDMVELVIGESSEPFQVVRCPVTFRTFCFLADLIRKIGFTTPICSSIWPFSQSTS